MSRNFTNIPGIGEHKNKELIKKGVKNVSDLYSMKLFETLPKESQYHLIYKPLPVIERKFIKRIDYSKEEISITLYYKVSCEEENLSFEASGWPRFIFGRR